MTISDKSQVVALVQIMDKGEDPLFRLKQLLRSKERTIMATEYEIFYQKDVK